VAATARNAAIAAGCRTRLNRVDWHELDATVDTLDAPPLFEEFDWVINCIGIIKPLIHDDNALEVEGAVRVNALFPHLLANWTGTRNVRVLQIATDCVFSGETGRYTEKDQHDALDVYGKTKSLGEVYAPHVHHLRCSIIGPEAKEPKSLMEWFLGQPQGASVNGFVNHRWNGVTTLHFGKLCAGIIKRGMSLPHLQHVLPDGDVTKYEMLQHFARCYRRDDVTVRPTKAAKVIDRTLETTDQRLNRELWTMAGYAKPPSVPQMIEELAMSDYRMKAKSIYAGD
jgi:dTDP-4-dehydrorhamnose reductase